MSKTTFGNKFPEINNQKFIELNKNQSLETFYLVDKKNS